VQAGREQIARYLVERGYDVFPCEQLANATRFKAVVLLDSPEGGHAAIPQARGWLAASTTLRVVVVTAKPAGWRALALALGDRVVVLAAPAFGWEIVDALRAGSLAPAG
jgi:hypothetical protein